MSRSEDLTYLGLGVVAVGVLGLMIFAPAKKPTFGQGGTKSVRMKGTATITDYQDGSELVVAPTASWKLDSRGVQTILLGTQDSADAITDAWKAGLSP
jgi:hypothetical protein